MAPFFSYATFARVSAAVGEAAGAIAGEGASVAAAVGPYSSLLLEMGGQEKALAAALHQTKAPKPVTALPTIKFCI